MIVPIAEAATTAIFSIQAISLTCSIGTCSTKPSNFISKGELKQHRREAHKISSKRCLVRKCKRSFPTKLKLVEHLLKHHHSNGSQWGCGQCDGELKSYRSLRKHVYFHHERGQFRCGLADCKFIGLTRLSVFKHYRRAHQPYICSVDMSNRSVQKNHQEDDIDDAVTGMESSSSETGPEDDGRKFFCTWPECGHSSRFNGNMVKHVRVKHLKLPRSLKLQKEQNIEDDRNVKDFYVKGYVAP